MSEAWTRKEGKNPKGGLNEKGRKSYEAANPGSDLKAPQPKGGPRKKSFCARMGGMKKKLTSSKTANDPNSRINKSLRAWKCKDGGAVRDYKDEYRKFQDSPAQKKKRAALNRENHKRGTYGNGDGLDVSHTKNGIKLEKSSINKGRKEKSRMVGSKRKKQKGGYLSGPSHKNGGIPAVVAGSQPVELEGGEYIIRKSSVDKLGKDVLAEINEKGRIPTMAKGGLTHKEKHKRRVASKMSKDIIDDNPMNQIDITKVVKHLHKGKKFSKPKTTTKKKTSGEPKLVTDKGYRAYLDSQREILKYREGKQKGSGPVPPAWTRDADGNIVKKKKTVKKKKFVPSKADASADYEASLKNKKKKEVKKETRKEMYDRKGWRYDDTIPGYNRDGTKKTTKKVETKPKKVVTKPKTVVKKKTKADKILDAGSGVFGSKANQREAYRAERKKERTKAEVKERLSKAKPVDKTKLAKIRKDKTDPLSKVKMEKVKGKDQITFKKTQPGVAYEKKMREEGKYGKRSKVRDAMQKMKNLLNKRGSIFRGKKYVDGGYMPSAAIPAEPKFRQGMRMMGHGGQVSTSNDKAGCGDVHTIHTHSGYKVGE